MGKNLADCYLEYARMLKDLEDKKIRSLATEERSEIYFTRALEIYRELKLAHKVKEIEKYLR